MFLLKEQDIEEKDGDGDKKWHIEKKADGYMLEKVLVRMEVKRYILGLQEYPLVQDGMNINVHVEDIKMSRWVSKGKSFRGIGATWSSNPEKAERTLKSRSSGQKKAFGRSAARKYSNW